MINFTLRTDSMAHSSQHITDKKDKIRWSQLIAYGFGGIIPIALFNIAGQLMGLIGNISLGLSAFWLGTLLIIPRLWDAISDPLMGHITDNTRTRWGRRRPYLLIGGIAVALSFVGMWWVPKGEGVNEWFQLGYILFFMLVFFTACTVFEIPHGALGMEMSSDPHERTRLFSAKSFLGNLFAMATPWLFALANLEFFKGAGGSEIDGMRWVSALIAVILIPMSVWWFFSCREPELTTAQQREKTHFWKNMRVAAGNKTFRRLVIIIFILAMGFNFVGLLSYYISIFFLYGGDKSAAGPLLGINGTVWALTGLLAVFPLNWLGRRLGKKQTLGIAILLMLTAQLTKIVCYNPQHPYLVVIPTVLLSAGMLMLFTLGSSMLGDICDEDELATGTRSQGSYYSVYWWFIKLGTAFASFVTGLLIVFSHFNEEQPKHIDGLQAEVKVALLNEKNNDIEKKKQNLTDLQKKSLKVADYFHKQAQIYPESKAHYDTLAQKSHALHDQATYLLQHTHSPNDIEKLLIPIQELTKQSPESLLRMRIFEIGIPILLCVIALWLLKFYPLDDNRAYEVKQLLEARRKENTDNQPL